MEKSLHELARTGSGADVVTALSSGAMGSADLLAKDLRGRTPLAIACDRGSAEVLHVLLAALKAAVASGSVTQELAKACLNGSDLLAAAADLGHAECVEALLVNDVAEVSGEVATSALYIASRRGYAPVCAVILALCSSMLTLQPEDSVRVAQMGNTPLHVAIEQNRLEVFKVLLSKRSDFLNAANDAGCTPLIQAVMFGRVEMVSHLVDEPGIDINHDADGLGTALYCACSGLKSIGAARTLEIVSHLLQAQDINTNIEERQTGCTPLIAAARSGSADLVSLLLSQDSRGDIARFLGGDEGDDGEDNDADEEIWENGDEQVASADKGKCQVNLCSFDGETALMAAAVRGHAEIVSLLLAHRRINVNVQNVFGSTALSLAARRGHEHIVRLLIACPSLNWSVQERSALGAAASDEIRSILREGAASAAKKEARCDVWTLSPLRIASGLLFSPPRK